MKTFSALILASIVAFAGSALADCGGIDIDSGLSLQDITDSTSAVMAEVMLLDGTQPMEADLPMGGQDVAGAQDGSFSGTVAAATINATNGYRGDPDDVFTGDEWITLDKAQRMFDQYAPSTLFSSTNRHGTITADATLQSTILEVEWTNTVALSVGTNVVFVEYNTNAVDTFVGQGTWNSHTFANFSGTGNPTVQWFFELIVSDGSTTTVLSRSAENVDIQTDILPHDAHAHLLTNALYGPTFFLGKRHNAIRTGGASATINFYGGTDARNTHLSGPALIPAQDYVTQTEYDDGTNAIAVLTLNAANHTNRFGAFGVFIADMTNATFNFYRGATLPYNVTVTNIEAQADTGFVFDFGYANRTNALDNYTVSMTGMVVAANTYTSRTALSYSIPAGDCPFWIWTNGLATNAWISADYTW